MLVHPLLCRAASFICQLSATWGLCCLLLSSLGRPALAGCPPLRAAFAHAAHAWRHHLAPSECDLAAHPAIVGSTLITVHRRGRIRSCSNTWHPASAETVACPLLIQQVGASKGTKPECLTTGRFVASHFAAIADPAFRLNTDNGRFRPSQCRFTAEI